MFLAIVGLSSGIYFRLVVRRGGIDLDADYHLNLYCEVRISCGCFRVGGL